ncbi:5-(carboxyamino)imidazole ribonucleotide mutase [candidate division WOR-3 bacterium 4484_100]|uniref:N5-carboxyaminoimidazole ribonucleotide mutase n=1 Tax=candidate division WOR-3 bacterium 4484_100 TaxID=1936077 RepID=A0A1V4QEH9_UNCW3|nr:MAG: 5-(carboxyamino)imidazole ribonucleotide mutase [candidate division WOR-3 bacterium 4484_100]
MKVWLFMGSKSDLEVMARAEKILEAEAVPYERFIHSAHREPEKIRALIEKAKSEDVVAIIAGAGLAAHLPGFIASLTDIPVLGVPLSASSLGGLDSLLSIVQMPSGVPVATFGIGGHGAANAAIFASRLYHRLKNR